MDKTTLDFNSPASEANEIALLVETSWEVCNKVGGIYTVLSTKAQTLQKYYGDKLIFVGPDVWSAEKPSPFFKEQKSLLKTWQQQLQLPEGVTVRVGRWDVPGKPIAILVGFQSMFAQNDALYGRMWQLYGVDSLHAYGDYGEACAFSHAAAIVIENLAKHYGIAQGKRMIAHFDEWTTGMALLYIKSALPQMATVFTTHATSIGRSICGNGKNLYEYLQGYDGDQMARELNMEAKHSLEKSAAHQADCFTTVSEVTARECEQLLGRKPDVVTPNGFEENFVPGKIKYARARAKAREVMLGVASALTGAEFDSDNTFIITTSGRCEYRNKGLDLYLDACARLGDLDPDKRIVAFVMVPAWVKAPRADLAEALANGKHERLSEPINSHDINNPWEDAVISRIRQIGFANDADSRLTMIYVPCYLNGNDGIFNLSYYDLLPGMDATVFPSYYEPWGYTPLESIAFGVPTITTSLSGFGQWVLDTAPNEFYACGVKVEKRNDNDYNQVCEAIAVDLKSLVDAAPSEIAIIRKAAMATAEKAAWSYFIAYYDEAYEIALCNAQKRNNK